MRLLWTQENCHTWLDQVIAPFHNRLALASDEVKHLFRLGVRVQTNKATRRHGLRASRKRALHRYKVGRNVNGCIAICRHRLPVALLVARIDDQELRLATTV